MRMIYKCKQTYIINSMDRRDEIYITAVTMVYSVDQLEDLKECIDSLINQKYNNYEILLVSESREVSEAIKSEYDSDKLRVKNFNNTKDGGISAARNKAIELAEGDVVAYIDTDAVADEVWLEEIAKTYIDKDCIAVGGKSLPDWIHSKPSYLPDEFLWLVGVTHKNHPSDGEEVRNTFGCNMSFKKSILEDMGGFNKKLGKNQKYNLQGEESELGIRMMRKYDQGMQYNSSAVVHHKVEEDQTNIRWLSKRAYLQGVTKAIIEKESSSYLPDTEKKYFISILNRSLGYLKNVFFGSKRIKSLVSLLGLLYFTFLVGIGYLVKKIR